MKLPRPTRVLLAASLALVLPGLPGCSDDAEPPADEDAATEQDAGDATVWLDVPKDSFSPIIDTSAPKDTGPEDTGPPDTGGAKDAAGLAKPATVPTDLPPDVKAIALSSVVLEEDGGSPTLKAVLPQGTTSFMAVVLGEHPAHFSVATAVNPFGDILGKGICSALCLACKNRLGGTAATGAALFPSSSAVKVIGGTWHLSTCGFIWTQTGNQYSTKGAKGHKADTLLFARVGQGGETPSKGRLKVRLWLSTPAATPASSYDHPIIKGMVKGAATALATAGIELAIIDRLAAPTGYAQLSVPAKLTVDHSSAVDTLFAAAAKVGGSAVLDVFVVDVVGGLEEGDNKAMGGWSGGIPGPIFHPGRVRSGVLVALKAQADGQMAGRRLAHEIGHYLGLWNTTEADGSSHDPLADTPQCTMANDKDGNTVLSAEECKAAGGDNVMFWDTPAADAKFSAEQGAIMRGNPLVWAL